MRTLILFRHAKSDRSDETLADAARPLNDRGREAAARMGEWLSREALSPDLVICSTAVRAMQTWELAAPRLDRDVPVNVDERFYLAEPDQLIALVRPVGDPVERLLLVGHNPGFEELANELASSGKKKELERMRKKFPTAAMAVIDLEIDRWTEISSGVGRLRRFVRPADLDF